MFSGWRVRIVCLAVKETVHIPIEDFRSFECSSEDPQVLCASIPILGKLYRISADKTGVLVERLS